jgi:hypothetical protein
VVALAQAPSAPPDAVHQVQPGETLFGLAQHYTGRSEHWVALQQHNGIPDPRRIAPGTRVRIPAALLAPVPVFATVVHVSGTVRQRPPNGAEAMPLQAGDRLPEGTDIEVGADGYLRLQLADGSTVRVPANSALRLLSVRQQEASQASDTRILLDAGRVDASAQPQRGSASRFEIRTPLAVASVRGTEFGVGVQPDAGVTGEVTHGVVELQSLGRPHGPGPRRHRLREGEGASVSRSGVLGPVRALPEAPDLALLPETVTEVDFVRLRLPPKPGIRGYRVRIASDGAMAQVVRNGEFAPGPLQFAGLEDGRYTIGVRAVDEAGLSGRESARALRVKARPVAPLAQRPAPGERIVGSAVEFACAQPEGIRRFSLQVASDEAFQSLRIDQPELSECRHAAALPPGRYFWRVASVGTTPDGARDQGPFGAAGAFEVVAPPPAAPPPTVRGDDGALQVHWAGRPGERYLVQVARDAGFTDLAYADTRSEASLRLPDLAAGTYHVRIRAVLADGETGSFSPPQTVRVRAVLHDGSGAPVRDAAGTAIGRQ